MNVIDFYLADQENVTIHPYRTLPCKGHPCTICNRCCDWYYNGSSEDWEWIRTFRDWDHSYAQRWRSGNYCNKFKLRSGGRCNRSIYYSASYIARFFSFGTFDGSHLLNHLCVCDPEKYIGNNM